MAPRKPDPTGNPSRGSGLRNGLTQLAAVFTGVALIQPGLHRCARGSRGVHEIRRRDTEERRERARERERE